MIKEIVWVTNKTGLHARPASVLAKTIRQFQCVTTLNYKGKNIKPHSAMALLTAGIKANSQVELICEGVDEQQAISELKRLFAIGFGHD
ncbi:MULTISPECIES: HPr family phosphocarrier protein [unclassified Escherichia]|uniref:HPr family phosphocarrier protein n=1 Tax=unclassified Escherichia TaxID=2608889 RepID=UPI000CF77914|nr:MULTISPECIES: HPr family phosphocarrier protein [unclassified Escherichia]MBB2399244.1 HPr family phosphocarrier protein [Escherichia sp. 14.0993]